MSTFVYAMLENRRRRAAAREGADRDAALRRRGASPFALAAPQGLDLGDHREPRVVADDQAQGDEPDGDGVKSYVEALAALVPAEVLGLHALVLTFTTQMKDGQTSISAPETLEAAFWGLIAMSVLLYVVSRATTEIRMRPAGTPWYGVGAMFTATDWLRAAIPPLAFVAWTMLQRMTAFDAAFGGVKEADRNVAGLFLAVTLGAAASWLAMKRPGG